MSDDEAATGVAYETHDVRVLDRDADRDTQAEQDEAAMLRRFARRMRAMPAEPMS